MFRESQQALTFVLRSLRGWLRRACLSVVGNMQVPVPTDTWADQASSAQYAGVPPA